jgi:hypothetical protein
MYSHDYTLPQHADQLLREAQLSIRQDKHYEAEKRINEARKLLQQYLAQDNMIPDDDVEGGWVRACDIETVFISGKDISEKIKGVERRNK